MITVLTSFTYLSQALIVNQAEQDIGQTAKRLFMCDAKKTSAYLYAVGTN